MPVSYPRQEGESFSDQADRDYAAMLDQFRPFVSVIVQSQDLVNLGGHFYSTGVIDKGSYEQALIFPTSKGLIITTGCAHPGILEIVKHARESTKQDVYFVMDGFHLMGMDSSQVNSLVQELRSLTRLIGPCHCTGGMAEDIFRDVFKEDCIDFHAGLRLELDHGESE